MLVATAADGSAHPVQLTSQAPTVLSDERMDASQLERVLRRIHRRELFGRLIDHYELSPGDRSSSTSPRCRPAAVRPADPAPGGRRRGRRASG